MKKHLLLFSLFFTSCSLHGLNIVDKQVPKTAEQIRKEVLSDRRHRFHGEVRVGSGVCVRELNTIAKRLPIAYEAIKKVTGDTTLKMGETPMVSLVCSGGGYRAMISTAAFFKALEEIGVLDASLYAAGLSGSTWTLASWLSQDFSLEELRVFLRKQVATHIKDHPISFSRLAMNLGRKYYYGQPITLADIWGYLVGRVIFADIKDGAFEAKLSQLASKVQDGKKVFPLFTSVLSDASPYEWMDFSPYEVGSDFLNAWVSPDCFGKKFSKGSTSDNAPEPSFSYLTGMFGSAYAVSVWDILLRLKERVDTWGKHKDGRSFFAFDILNLLDSRLSPARVNGFTRKLAGCSFSGKKHFELVDGGMDFNLPFPSVLRRLPDIMLVCDVSGDSVDANIARALEHAQHYAKRKGFKFPKIEIKDLGAKTIDVFYDKHDPECPIVVYCPNKIDFSTLKLQYSGEEFDKLYNYMHNAVHDCRDRIADALRLAIKNVRDRRRSEAHYLNEV